MAATPRAGKDAIYKKMGKTKYMSSHKGMHKMPNGTMMKDEEMR